MSKGRSWAVIAALGAILIAISICQPSLLNNSNNAFLHEFVSRDLLGFLGIVVTITLASAASLHLELNKLEDATEKKFPQTRAAIRLSAYSLIVALTLGILVVATKFISAGNEVWTALWNSAAYLLVVFSVAVLFDLTSTVLAIPSVSEVKNRKPVSRAVRKGAAKKVQSSARKEKVAALGQLDRAFNFSARRKNLKRPPRGSIHRRAALRFWDGWRSLVPLSGPHRARRKNTAIRCFNFLLGAYKELKRSGLRTVSVRNRTRG